MKEWQFNILFFVGVGGAIFLVLGPVFHIDTTSNPTALAGIGSILTYILTQKKSITKRRNSKSNDDEEEPPKIESVYDDHEKGDDDK